MKKNKPKLLKIKNAAFKLKLTEVVIRNSVLIEISKLLKDHSKKIIQNNQKDLNALSSDYDLAFRDRLKITDHRLNQMTESLKYVASCPDPIGSENVKIKTLKNKLILKKIRSPLGVVLMIFESRPNVAIEAFSIGFKSGNAMILRGGKESHFTTKYFYKLIQLALKKYKLPKDCIWGITDSSRDLVNDLLKEKKYIDVVVPRGGESLIQYVSENTQIPIIKNDRGLCHIYVHKDADINIAVNILTNAKTQRPSVCNSMETMLIHESIAKKLLPLVYNQMNKFNVQWFGCKKTKSLFKDFKNVKLATLKNWDTEYLNQTVNCKIVKSETEALNHISEYGSHHSEGVITKNKKLAYRFQSEVDASVVYWNASTRFTDGFEFGLGGELGISTQKLHVRGPVGLEALTSERWIAEGTGQIRE